MATVHLGATLCRPYCGDVREVQVEARNISQMLRELDKKFPGIAKQIDESMAIAIDGVIFQDTVIEPIEPDSEVHLIPKIAGG
ncbi:MAG TPA: MoaD/ThiS family protein [Alphaproteobacteria bacterium]|nr:MoaD/ThiS family protein [Alphaproteobacteria bacterium]